MKNLSFYTTKKKICELFIFEIISFVLFRFEFGGLPSGEWIGLNILPLIAGIFSWITFQVIVSLKLNTNKVKEISFLILTCFLLCKLFLFLLKKL